MLDAHLQRAVHLGFVLTLVYLLYPFTKGMRRDRINPVDLLFVAASLFCLGYLLVNYRSIVTQAGRLTPIDVVVGIVGILLVFEAARRIVGLPMVIIAALFVLYALFGEWLPGAFAHRNMTIPQLVNHLCYTIEGMFGIPLGVSASFVFLFLLFAAFIEITGIGKLFIDIGNWLAGWASGGPAKVAVITSALEGMVEGSSVSNVVGSGSFTIPMMKKLGYRAEFAGAVEAAASTGGQIMPPIMGAAAFLMAEFLNIPYSTSPRPRPSPRCCTSAASSRASTSRRRSWACAACRGRSCRSSCRSFDRRHQLHPARRHHRAADLVGLLAAPHRAARHGIGRPRARGAVPRPLA